MLSVKIPSARSSKATEPIPKVFEACSRRLFLITVCLSTEFFFECFFESVLFDPPSLWRCFFMGHPFFTTSWPSPSGHFRCVCVMPSRGSLEPPVCLSVWRFSSEFRLPSASADPSGSLGSLSTRHSNMGSLFRGLSGAMLRFQV